MAPRSPPRPARPPDRLEKYRGRRSAARTPEPFGPAPGSRKGASAGGGIFVVQKHAASSLHWDFRLESEGILLSWAVPKGPSADPADKRLAIQVEDHPLDYADFEGVIPEGEYGAGPVIVWDRGSWTPIADGHRGVDGGKLLFELHGFKLRGRWTLVKTKQSESSWLLIKERDSHANDRGTAHYPDDSIYSGLLVEELPEAEKRARALRKKVERTGAKQGTVRAAKVKAMLASTADEPFSRKGWIFEIKYDGYRIVAGKEDEQARLLSRSGREFTATFPEITRAMQGLPFTDLVIDGEVVVHGERGLPDFGRLQKRGLLERPADIARAARELPATFHAFDLLGIEGFDLRSLPLLARKEFLQGILPSAGPIRFTEHIATRGKEMYRGALAMGLEGVMAKRGDSPYRGGRSSDWLKVRATRTDDFVVVGWTEPQGSRAGFGALHLAQYDAQGKLLYRGSVGTGFDDRLLTELHERLQRLEVKRKPFPGEVAVARRGRRTHHWARPEVVGEVGYTEITAQGLLRHPVFVRVREDKPPEECRVREPEAAAGRGGAIAKKDGSAEGKPRGDATRNRGGSKPRGGATRNRGGSKPRGGAIGKRAGVSAGREDPPTPPPRTIAEPDIAFTNLDKVFWPDRGFTKGDLIDYYRKISPWLLPYLRDRPLVLTRFPDGIDGKSFYQKNAPEWVPDWLETVKIWSEDSGREVEYFIANDLEALLYLVNLGTIPIHLWSSRVSSLDYPDWCILDLDPKEAPFTDVITIAKHIHGICEEIELPVFVKTSGSSGLHLLIPLGTQLTYDQSRTLAELLARATAAELHEIATVVRSTAKRGGKVYVDFLQNGKGQHLAAPFCVRAVPEAGASAPLRWKEVTRRLTPRAYRIDNLPARMRRLREDPLLPVLDLTPDLAAALARLRDRQKKNDGPTVG